MAALQGKQSDAFEYEKKKKGISQTLNSHMDALVMWIFLCSQFKKQLMRNMFYVHKFWQEKNEEKRYNLQEWGITQVLESTQDAELSVIHFDLITPLISWIYIVPQTLVIILISFKSCSPPASSFLILKNRKAAAAAAAAKSLQSCPTLCDPIDSSLPGSAVPGILQARTLEWVAIAFSNSWR